MYSQKVCTVRVYILLENYGIEVYRILPKFQDLIIFKKRWEMRTTQKIWFQCKGQLKKKAYISIPEGFPYKINNWKIHFCNWEARIIIILTIGIFNIYSGPCWKCKCNSQPMIVLSDCPQFFVDGGGWRGE